MKATEDRQGVPLAWPVIGILGGMGPLAGIDLAEKLISCAVGMADVTCDQDHVPFILWSIPQIPDRSAAVLDPMAPDPFPAMAAGIQGLTEAGAEVIAIPCNTAHHWHARLSQISRVPILHIVDTAISALGQLGSFERVGVIGGLATIRLEIYQSRLREKGYSCVIPTDIELAKLVVPSITLTKQSRLSDALPLAQAACSALKHRGAEALVLGCTELPLIFERAKGTLPLPALDPARALAEACLRHR